jgi:hypothetical protein
MTIRTVGAEVAVILPLIAPSAHADKIWLKDDSSVVAQFTFTSGYPNNESCLFRISTLTDDNGAVATFAFSLLRGPALSPFSYTDKTVQWSHNELVQVLVDGNKPILNQARINEYHDLSGLLIIPSSHLVEQMSRGHTLTVTTRAGARTFQISTEAVKAFQKCAHEIEKRR